MSCRQIGPLTTIYSTQCQCTHLTSFGGDFVVPPNTIDFSTVFSLEKFLESMPVFITVIIVLVIYVGTMIWARREDKKDLIKVGYLYWNIWHSLILLCNIMILI